MRWGRRREPPPHASIAGAIVIVRPALRGDHAAILALNLDAEALMSPMDAQRLQAMDAESICHRVVCDGDAVVAFLLVFDQNADYDSPNFLWYRGRYPRFLYIDRIAVARSHRGRGLGGMLYDDLFAFARERGFDTVAAEFYIEPFNEISSRFHARYGFSEVGTQWVAQATKRVSLQIAAVPQRRRESDATRA